MLIKTFEKLWKEKNPQGKAWVPDKYATNQRASNVVCVTFNENSKVYKYKGTILQVATRLDLIPEIDVVTESKQLAQKIRVNGFAIGHAECHDTISHLMGEIIDDDFYQTELKDEFGRKLVKFEIGNNDAGW